MKLRALIIQDHDGVALALRLCLAQLDIAAVITDMGEDALDIASRERFDLVMVDDALPDLSGYEVLRMLRLGAILTPAIFVSSSVGDPEIRAIAEHAGANAFLAVPFTPAACERAVAEVLPRYRGFGPWP